VDPLYERLLHLIAEKKIVLADETTQRVQAKGKTRTAWLWSFIARDEAERELIAYVFSRSRSGETPVRVLEGTIGKLLVDGYDGYNKMTLPGGRERAGCWAHARRKFFDAQSTAPAVAKHAVDLVLELYKIERAALNADLLGTREHLAMRQTAQPRRHRRVQGMARRRAGTPSTALADRRRDRLRARSVGRADALPHRPASADRQQRVRARAARKRPRTEELPLRRIGRGRREPAGLYSLVATCEANGVNPVDYLADVLLRVQTHPTSRIDELLPHNWTPPRPEPSA
jgi:transposase